MPDALTIDFALTNWNRVEKAFNLLAKLSSVAETRMKSLESAVDSTAVAYSRLNTEMDRFNRLSGQGGSSGLPSVRSFSPSTGTSRASKVNGPFQRQEKLEQRMQTALGTVGSEHSKAGPSSAVSRLGNMLTGAKLAGPVAEIAAEALGPEVMALAGPVGLVVAAVTSAATAMMNLAKNAADASAAFTSFQFSVGSMGADSSQALAIGRQGGLSADATASQANSLQSAITGSAIGRAYGMKLGVFNLGGAYGSMDIAKNYVTAMDHLRTLPMDDRIRTAKQTGLESSLSSTMTSDKQYSLGKTDAGVHAQIFDPSFAQKSLDFNAALGRVSDAATNLMTVLGKPFIDGLTNFFNALATAMNNIALFLNGPVGKMVIAGLSAMTPLGALGGSASAGSLDGSTANAHIKAMQDNTRATADLSQRLPGVYGNDTDGRLAASRPGGAGYNAMAQSRQDFVTGAIRLGAF